MAFPQARRSMYLGGGPVGGGAVGIDNLPITTFQIALTTASGKDYTAITDALVQMIPVSMEQAAREFADKLVVAAHARFNSTGLMRGRKLRPGAVHMQDHIFPRYPEPGDPELTFGLYTGSPAWHTEYHEHGTFAQRRMPSGFQRQYRARSGGKYALTANSKVPSGLEQVRGRRKRIVGRFETLPGGLKMLHGRLGVRATHWLTDTVASQADPYLRAVGLGMANYLRAAAGGASEAAAMQSGLKSTFRSLGKSGLANVNTGAIRQTINSTVVLP